ncbi:MAG: S-adenosylmethionine decarboxylase [Candidatus Bathyarchaeia archaeon]
MPQINRKRLIIEGFYEFKITPEFIENFLEELSKRLGMSIITGPLIFSPSSKAHSTHIGLAGFMAWVESGVSFYTWSNYKFFTLDIYTCKDFKIGEAVEFARKALSSPKLVYEEFHYED